MGQCQKSERGGERCLGISMENSTPISEPQVTRMVQPNNEFNFLSIISDLN